MASRDPDDRVEGVPSRHPRTIAARADAGGTRPGWHRDVQPSASPPVRSTALAGRRRRSRRHVGRPHAVGTATGPRRRVRDADRSGRGGRQRRHRRVGRQSGAGGHRVGAIQERSRAHTDRRGDHAPWSSRSRSRRSHRSGSSRAVGLGQVVTSPATRRVTCHLGVSTRRQQVDRSAETRHDTTESGASQRGDPRRPRVVESPGRSGASARVEPARSCPSDRALRRRRPRAGDLHGVDHAGERRPGATSLVHAHRNGRWKRR